VHSIKTLKFQIGAALLLIVILFTGAFTINMSALDEQRSYSTLLNITARLQHTSQNLIDLGMNYAVHAPQDLTSYQRDIMLYYRELRNQIGLFDQITDSFMSENFAPSLTNRDTPFTPNLDAAVHTAVAAIEETWATFKSGLEQALGPDDGNPRLGAAADYITRHHQPLAESISALRSQIQRLVEDRLEQVNQTYWVTLAIVITLTLGILLWFFLAILRPLNHAVAGFQKVAQGDFGYQVQTFGDNELTWLTRSFNQLSSRLHAIFRLIDQIQQGSDLDDTLCFVAEHFPQLLPLDWVGALFVAGDGNTFILEKSYRDGQPEPVRRRHFRLQETLLQKALIAGKPLHIPDMKRTAQNNPKLQFLNHMVDNGLRDAIFLPITDQSPIPGILAFATREPESYSPEHLELLSNIAKLITHSFGRTVKLAEHSQLAAIGSFASGIAHEIRTPLSTINMTLDYMQKNELPPHVAKRVQLAHQEAGRMARLLEEILLYAKPMKLKLRIIDMAEFLLQFLEGHGDYASARRQKSSWSIQPGENRAMVDPDRMTQVLLNLANNAAEAAPEQGTIHWEITRNQEARTLTLSITNTAPPIPEEILSRLFDPFFTTKANGTGLGLGIIKRILDAHGGEIEISSSQPEGTRVAFQLPLD